MNIAQVRDYWLMVFKLWGRAVAGPAFGILAIALAAAEQFAQTAPAAAMVVAWSAKASLALAVLMIFWAQYDAWAIEREAREAERRQNENQRRELESRNAIERERLEDRCAAETAKYQAEAAKNARPEIAGEAFGFHRHGIFTEGHDSGRRPVWSFGVRCEFFLCNLRPTPATLRGIEVDGSQLAWMIQSAEIHPAKLPALLELGIGHAVYVTIDLSFFGKPPKPPERLPLESLRIWAVDSFGARHSIVVRSGESVSSAPESP